MRVLTTMTLLVIAMSSNYSLAQEGLSSDVVDMLNGPQAKQAQEAIEVGVESFKVRFLENVPAIPNETISDCRLISDLQVRSALKQYGKNPEVTDMFMLTLSGMQRSWAALYELKVADGVNMNVGQAVAVFKSQDMSKALSFVEETTPNCNKIFKTAQADGLKKQVAK